MYKLTEKTLGRIQYDVLAPGQFHHSLRDHHYRRRRRRRHSELEGRDRNCAKYNILK